MERISTGRVAAGGYIIMHRARLAREMHHRSTELGSLALFGGNGGTTLTLVTAGCDDTVFLVVNILGGMGGSAIG